MLNNKFPGVNGTSFEIIMKEEDWISEILEQNKLLEGLILSFYQELREHMSSDEDSLYWLDKYREHFNITVTRQGHVE